MHLNPLVQGISGVISGGISIKDFAMVIKSDQITAKEILDELLKNDIGKKYDERINFEPGDKLKCALFALKKGAIIDEVSVHLDWKAFEGLVAEILDQKEFATIRNLVLTKPRMEIDVVGIKHGTALLVDCKHWKKFSIGELESVVKKQVQRTKHYVSKTPGSVAVPAIVTLFQERTNIINKVPIIPIQQFASFVDEFYGNLNNLEIIKS